MKRFRNLSKAQSDVFENICAGNDLGHSSKTLRELESKGLIECSGHFTIRSRVPIAIHMEWCQWCDDNFDFDDDGNPIEKGVKK